MRSKGFPAAMTVLLASLAVILLVTGTPAASGEADRYSDSPGLPTAYFHPNVLYFRVGTESTRTTTLTNTSTETLSIRSFALLGSKQNDCSMTTRCPFSLAAGASCTVSLTCSQTAPGRITELIEYDNSAVGSHNVMAWAK